MLGLGFRAHALGGRIYGLGLAVSSLVWGRIYGLGLAVSSRAAAMIMHLNPKPNPKP